jgi:hypothetical protein
MKLLFSGFILFVLSRVAVEQAHGFAVTSSQGGARSTLLHRPRDVADVPASPASRRGRLLSTSTDEAEGIATKEPSSDRQSQILTPELSTWRIGLLREAVKEYNSTAARRLVQDLADLRRNGTDPLTLEAILDDMLAQGPDRTAGTGCVRQSVSKLRSWVLRRFFTRVSDRARMESLRRTLDLTTPPPNEDGGSGEDSDISSTDSVDPMPEQRRRRRRALVSLLRQLASPCDDEDVEDPEEDGRCAYRGGAGIRHLEKKASREARRQAQLGSEDLTTRRPRGLETPEYNVVSVLLSKKRGKKNRGRVEIRRYQPFSLCTVSMERPRPVDSYKTDATVSDPTTGGARAFGALAGYLFGKNDKQQAMAMTTPVISRRTTTEASSGKVMSFVLPSKFWSSLEGAPKPLDGSGVTLQQEIGGDRAVVMFGGYVSASETERRKEQLLSALADSEEWEAADEPITLAQYNDPFTPPWNRVNEVSVAVRPVQHQSETP